MLVLIFAIQMIMSIVMLMGMGTRWVPATHGGYGYGVILYPWWVVGMGMGQFFPSGYGYGFVCPLGTLPTAIPSDGDSHATNKIKKFAVAGDRTRVTRVTGGNTHHYTTTTKLKFSYPFRSLYTY